METERECDSHEKKMRGRRQDRDRQKELLI